MPVEWIEDADAETDRPRRQRARGETGHRPAPEGILSEPHRGEPGLLRRPGLRRAFPGRKSSVNTEGDARARAHGPPMAQMSPGRGSRLACENCAWTVFQPPGSLTIPMVDR